MTTTIRTDVNAATGVEISGCRTVPGYTVTAGPVSRCPAASRSCWPIASRSACARARLALGTKPSHQMHRECLGSRVSVERGPQQRIGRQRQPEIPAKRRHHPCEPFRGHADDRERLIVERDRAADGVGGRPESARPIGMRQHHHRSGAGAIVGGRKDAAAGRGDAEDREVVAADDFPEGVLGLLIDPQPERSELEAGQSRQSRVAVAILDERPQARRRKPVGADADQIFDRGDRQRSQEERVGEAEDGHRRADAEGEHRDRDRGEAGRPDQGAGAVAQVLNDAGCGHVNSG